MADRNTKNAALPHVSVGTRKSGTGTCRRCLKAIKPPLHESDAPAPICWNCKTRPPEGWSAYCHECTCSGAANAPGMCGCGARWSGDRVCHCAACHLTFTSVGPFDAHHPITLRRCMTADELRASGYEPNARGHWRKPAPEGTRWGGEHDGV